MIGSLESLSELWLDGNLLNNLPDVSSVCACVCVLCVCTIYTIRGGVDTQWGVLLLSTRPQLVLSAGDWVAAEPQVPGGL